MRTYSGNLRRYNDSLGVIKSMANRATVYYTISTNTKIVSISLSSLPGYYSSITDLIVTVNSGIYVWSDSISTPALSFSGINFGDTVTLINNGFIMGQGGKAGNSNNGAHTAGGAGINLTSNITIDNTNASAYIGGGGGGCAGFYAGATCYAGAYGYSGGGGAGGGSGGTSTNGATVVGTVGGNGTGGGGGRIFPGVGGAANTGGGAGGGGWGPGGSANNVSPTNAGGGGWGASGGNGGGAGGRAIVLNSWRITWVGGDTSRIYGAVS